MLYCPECGKTTGLYEMGTATLSATRTITAETGARGRPDVDDTFVSEVDCDWDGECGCAECDWEGSEDDLRDTPLGVEVDEDGEPDESTRAIDLMKPPATADQLMLNMSIGVRIFDPETNLPETPTTTD